ncbi:MAG: CapA family protein [Patescibacteria group bacterium]|nr:CapA family protein [Patescibacteria group bacterium]
MQNVKIIFILILGTFFLSGCVKNVDLRKQAEEEKAPEQKDMSSMQDAVDLPVETAEASSIQAGEPVKILFVGDMMFDRHIREAVAKYGSGKYNYVLEPMKEKLSEYDLVVGNLEGPITSNKSTSVNTKMGESKNFVFTFDPIVAKVLAENNIKLVNLGNNHILNQGEKGVEQTKKYLDETGVEYFDGSQSSTLGTENSVKLGFVSYNYSVPDSAETAIEEIKSVKEQSDVVVVCPHWGTEYKTGDPGNSVRALAYRFIDAGADAVIGTHPHVIQASEEYQGKKIYYSLGNFVFDQYFQPETMEGLGVEITINPDRSMEYGELKFEMTKKGQTIFKVEP